MPAPSAFSPLDLAPGTEGLASRWIARADRAGTVRVLGLFVAASALYGFCVGAWRAPLMGLFVAAKMPILLAATALVGGLIRALIAHRFGFELGLAASLRSVLAAYALASLVLASVAPVVLMLDLTLPAPSERGARSAHAMLALAHVAAVAFAGTLAVRRQRSWLEAHCVEPAAARRVVMWWLAIDLVVGAQLSWNLRPWFGTPGIDVQFLRDEPFRGTFHESLFRMFVHVVR